MLPSPRRQSLPASRSRPREGNRGALKGARPDTAVAGRARPFPSPSRDCGRTTPSGLPQGVRPQGSVTPGRGEAMGGETACRGEEFGLEPGLLHRAGLRSPIGIRRRALPAPGDPPPRRGSTRRVGSRQPLPCNTPRATHPRAVTFRRHPLRSGVGSSPRWASPLISAVPDGGNSGCGARFLTGLGCSRRPMNQRRRG